MSGLAGQLRVILVGAFVIVAAPAVTGAASLRFFGNGVTAPDLDRVKVQLDDPATTVPGPPADVGASDFTIEFWMKASAAENTAPAVSCGANVNWIYGNIVVDRDRFGQDRKFGLSIAGGRLVFGVSGEGTGDRTICGTDVVLDGLWHHVALQRRRSDGALSLYVDGALDAQGDGPDGDVSYPDDGVPCATCCGGGDCDNSDPFLVFGAEKHDAGSAYPSYSGWLDELRVSTVGRYTATFAPPTAAFLPDASTVALYHFDEGAGDVVGDSSGAVGGPSDGERRYGGTPPGPDWSTDTPHGAPGDTDGDGTPDTTDPCTVRLVGGQTTDRARLGFTRLDALGGSRGLAWRGSFVPAVGSPIAPDVQGAHLLIVDSAGAMVDLNVPGGLVGAHPSTPCDARDGWTVSRSATTPRYAYRNYSGFLDAVCSVPAQGVSAITIQDRRATGRGDVTFNVKGKTGTFAPVVPPLRVQGTLALAAQPAPGTASAEAIAGQCTEYVWLTPPALRPAPYCGRSPASGPVKSLLCKGP